MLSWIAFEKKKLIRTFDFGKQDVTDFTKFSNRNMCRVIKVNIDQLFFGQNFFIRKIKAKIKRQIKFGKTHILSTGN